MRCGGRSPAGNDCETQTCLFVVKAAGEISKHEMSGKVYDKGKTDEWLDEGVAPRDVQFPGDRARQTNVYGPTENFCISDSRE